MKMALRHLIQTCGGFVSIKGHKGVSTTLMRIGHERCQIGDRDTGLNRIDMHIRVSIRAAAKVRGKMKCISVLQVRKSYLRKVVKI